MLGIILMTEPHVSAQYHQLDARRPWFDPTLPAEVRARLTLEAMTLDEEIRLVHGRVGFSYGGKPKTDAAIGSASVNGTYSSESDFLLNQVLKRDWAYSVAL